MRELLLVDDQKSEAFLAEKALEYSGAQMLMSVVDSGQAAIAWLAARAARGGDPATVLVLMDLNMPMCDGVATLRRIRQDAVLSATPVLILTCSSEAKDQDRANGAGADGYIWKPASLADFCKFFNNLETFWFDHIAAAKHGAATAIT